MRTTFVLLLLATPAIAEDFQIVPATQSSNEWIVSNIVPEPPLTIYAEFIGPGVEPIRATIHDIDYLETGLHRITAANAANYGFVWSEFVSAITDPLYKQFAIGWQSSDGSFRKKIPWPKPTSATVTEWRFHVQHYAPAELSPFGVDQFAITTHVRGTRAEFGNYIPEPTSLLLSIAAVVALPLRRR